MFRIASFLLAFGIVSASSGMALMIEHEVEAAAGGHQNGTGTGGGGAHHGALAVSFSTAFSGLSWGESGHEDTTNAPAPAQTLFSGGLGLSVMSLVFISASHRRIWHETGRFAHAFTYFSHKTEII